MKPRNAAGWAALAIASALTLAAWQDVRLQVAVAELAAFCGH